MTTSRITVHLTGGEGIGWAVDEDLEMARRAVGLLNDRVSLTSMPDAQIVHSVYAPLLLVVSVEHLRARRVICHLENDLAWLLQQPYMRRAVSVVDTWIAQNETTATLAQRIGLRASYVPYAVDVPAFAPELPGDPTVLELRRRWALPDDGFLIGNFMRDTLGSDLTRPKPQKGADIFLAIVAALRRRGYPVHVVLAGPRRHWLRGQLREAAVPFTFIGRPADGDDMRVNVLPKADLRQLYRAVDLYLLTSRWEAGSRVLLEAAAAGRPIASTPVGLAPDLLEPASLFRSVDEGIALVEREIETRSLAATVSAQRGRVLERHTPAATAPRFQAVYEGVLAVPAGRASVVVRSPQAPARRSVLTKLLGRIRPSTRRVDAGPVPRFSIWHEFHKPPYGGGNQFLLALKGALEQRGATVHMNRLASDVDVHICNSAWFDVDRFTRYAESHPLRMLHRIDGPIALYRDATREQDDRIFSLNERFASATVLQSMWSYERLCDMGYRPVRPLLIKNAVDPSVFHARGRTQWDGRRKARLVATSWSDNPRKGEPVYHWLEEHLDPERFEFTFVGRLREPLQRARQIEALPSDKLADVLREHDIYVTASQRDPCSNALLEALACGLPALYLHDGGHPELAGHGGLPFAGESDVLCQLDRLVQHYEAFQRLATVRPIDEIASAYLELAQQVMQE